MAVAGRPPVQQHAAERGHHPAGRAPAADAIEGQAGAGRYRQPLLRIADVTAAPDHCLLGILRELHLHVRHRNMLRSCAASRRARYLVIRAPAVGVHEGESLAGNDSSDDSLTMSLRRQPRACIVRSRQSRAIVTSRRPMAARTVTATPAIANRPPVNPPRRAPSNVSADPQAAITQRSWS